MDSGHVFLAVEIGERPGHSQRPIIAARAQRQRVRRIAQERQTLGIGRGDLFEQSPITFGIGANPRLIKRCIARRLCRARGRDADPNLGASFLKAAAAPSAAETAGTSI